MITKFRDWLIDPTVRPHDVDSPAFSLAHRQIVQRKVILRRLFEAFYQECRGMDLRYFEDCPGARLEIGSGGGIINEIYPDVVTSDIKPLPFIDIVLSAENLPFANNSLRAIYAINVFHHLLGPRDFFREILRVVHPGGGVVFIEPFYGPLAAWVFKRLHNSETFEPDAPGWESSTRKGPFSGANQALSYVVFTRDRSQFVQEFPQLKLVFHRPHTQLSYLLSGGVNFRQLLPDRLTPLVKIADQVLSPLNRWVALQQTIVLRKN